ncbi:MAG: GNAT family N-acetyltransferase [Saccharofermentans sp.]|nr:GNAT family N-acetyltransferase [Saccharofermentans sp.]
MKKDFKITTERLTLEPLGLKHLETVHEYASDPLNTTYMLFLPNDTLEDTVGFLTSTDALWEDDNNPNYECAILLEGLQIGTVSLYVEDGVAELGWILNRKYWCNGYLTEAASALVKYAHENLGITHFIAHCDSENVGSYRVMEKVGMTFVSKTGGRRNKLTPEGEERFELLYELKF